MQFVRLGNSNLKVSRLALGAMGFGDRSWRDWVLDRDGVRPVLHRALDCGINFFDTCDFYSGGESERILGELLLKEVPRDSVVVATKVGNPMQGHPNGRGYSRKHVFEAVDASLRRLGTDYVDLYQTHVWDGEAVIEEVVDAFADVVRAGKALYVGAATMPTWSFCTALHLAQRKGLPRFLSMQCEYNPAHREAERELLPLCRAEGVGVIPFSPMARGFLSADRRAPANETARTRSDDYTRKHYYRPADHAVFEAVAAVASELGCSPSQAALAWTLGRPGITAPIFGATTADQVSEAAAALAITLSAEQSARIEAAYAARPLQAGGH